MLNKSHRVNPTQKISSFQSFSTERARTSKSAVLAEYIGDIKYQFIIFILRKECLFLPVVIILVVHHFFNSNDTLAVMNHRYIYSFQNVFFLLFEMSRPNYFS